MNDMDEFQVLEMPVDLLPYTALEIPEMISPKTKPNDNFFTFITSSFYRKSVFIKR